MSICLSLLAGYDGKYKILGTKVKFKEFSEPFYSFSNNLFGNAAENLLRNGAFRLLSFGYIHTFIHEMGHALALKVLTGYSSSIEIQTNTCLGVTSPNRGFRRLSPFKSTIFALAGPLADVVFSVSQIFTAVLLRSYLTAPVAIGITIGASTWIFGELFYAYNSLARNDRGDFAVIARNGDAHLLASTALMMGVIALGIFGSAKLLSA